jgi:hypothetical protein
MTRPPQPDKLPPALIEKAGLSGNEWVWKFEDFLPALQQAPTYGYACLGGQVQFCPEDGKIWELYWLSADSSERLAAEPWPVYVKRSCQEVESAFQQLLGQTDFRQELKEFPYFNERMAAAYDPTSALRFNAYFVDEEELARLTRHP